ncbi:hypothetical protein SFRURICE_010039 [Spodoptera frugiperda]|nr:hypothetical protein SFRURICE_010039 [Spodoptera frugiperda]
MTVVAHRLSTSKSTDDVINILHRTYEVYMRINTDRKSQRTTVGAESPPGMITSPAKSTDDVTNILHRTYEVYMRINTDRKSQRTTVGQKARQADHLAWSEDPPFLRELYSLFPKVVTPTSAPSSSSPSPSPITSPLSVYMRINTDRKSQRTTVGQKARQADHLAWSEDPPFLRELYSLFPKNLLFKGRNVMISILGP